MRRVLVLLAVITASISMGASAEADLIFEEQFDTGFTAGTLDGQGSGNPGLSGNFINGSNANFITTSLDFADPLFLAESGGSVNIPSSAVTGNGRQGQLIAAPVTDATVGTFYLSFLAQTGTDNANGYRAFELHDGGFSDGPNRTFQLGFQNGDFNSQGTNYGFRVSDPNGLPSVTQQLGVNDQGVNLFVVEFNLSDVADSDSVTVFQNPDLSTGLVPTTGGETIDNFNITFDRFTFARFGTNSGISFDEVRFADNFAHVTVGDAAVVPEPSSMGLIAVLGAGLFARRRRSVN